MRRVLVFYCLLLLYSCSPISKSRLTKTFNQTEKRFQDHTGFILYDPVEKKELYQFNADKYFTPASNTKILTFFASLKILGDSIPALRYLTSGDSLIFWGTGDPSFLYKNVFNTNRVFEFLKTNDQKLYFSASNFQTNHFGPGWAWDDYSDYYSTEKSAFPVYGNIFSLTESKSSVQLLPAYFKSSLIKTDSSTTARSTVKRDLNSNHVFYSPGKVIRNKTWDIPFKVDPLFITTLLQDSLDRPVTFIKKNIPATAKTIFSLPADSLYKVMMQESDNFIAEQLLLICAGVISDTLKTEIAIKHIKTNYLNDLKDNPVWVDGSGLSRYNLFSPRSITQVWEKIYALVPRERLFSLLATSGKSGTLQNYYKAEKPYIFGKTGTLSNNHNLSGYLLTRKGKVLIFSFMNNNYTCTTAEIRANMAAILKLIHERY